MSRATGLAADREDLAPQVRAAETVAPFAAHLTAHGGDAAKLSEAIDTVRRAEVTTRPELKHTRWLWLKNWANLSTKHQGELHRLMRPSAQLATARALRWREDFQAFYHQDPSYAPEYLRRWCSGAKRSRLQPIKDFVTLVEKNWEGIIAWHKNHLSNGPTRRDQLAGPGCQS